MKKVLFSAALAIAALSVSGCTGGIAAAPSPDEALTAALEASEGTSTATAPTYDGKAWATKGYEAWLESMRETHLLEPGGNAGVCYPIISPRDLRPCMVDKPAAFVVGFESPAPGELTVMVEPGEWQQSPYDSPSISGLQLVAQNVAPRLEKAGLPADKITVRLVGGTGSGAVEEITYDAGALKP